MAHPDEAVKVEHEEPSKDVAAAKARHDQAESDPNATAQEKKQAAVEQAHANANRPEGSYAQLHEPTKGATLAVADDGDVKDAKEAVDDAIKVRDSGEPTDTDKADKDTYKATVAKSEADNKAAAKAAK
jgi:hypothetical protein